MLPDCCFFRRILTFFLQRLQILLTIGTDYLVNIPIHCSENNEQGNNKAVSAMLFYFQLFYLTFNS